MIAREFIEAELSRVVATLTEMSVKAAVRASLEALGDGKPWDQAAYDRAIVRAGPEIEGLLRRVLLASVDAAVSQQVSAQRGIEERRRYAAASDGTTGRRVLLALERHHTPDHPAINAARDHLRALLESFGDRGYSGDAGRIAEVQTALDAYDRAVQSVRAPN